MKKIGETVRLTRRNPHKNRTVTLGEATGTAPADVKAGDLVWRGGRAHVAEGPAVRSEYFADEARRSFGEEPEDGPYVTWTLTTDSGSWPYYEHEAVLVVTKVSPGYEEAITR